MSGSTNVCASAVGILARLSPWVMESTGVGPTGLRATSGAPFAGVRLGEVEQVRVADDRTVLVERLDGVGQSGLEQCRVGHFGVSPAAEAAVVVDRRAPRVARRGGF